MRTEPIEQYDISPVKLWSLLQRQLAGCGLTKGSPQQWIGTIRNLQRKGVSSVEVDWSGCGGPGRLDSHRGGIS